MRLEESVFQIPGINRGLRFYVTAPAPCPYLPGEVERKGFTQLKQEDPDALHDTLSRAGFRRSQSVAYRPACPSCNACRSVRVDTENFTPSRNQKRVLKTNSGLHRDPVEAKATREQFRLLRKYLKSRHNGGGMSEMKFRDYVGMVNDSPVKSLVFEYRDGPEDDAPLLAASLTDIVRDGLSMVYTFFDPELSGRSFGTHMILDHIQHANALGLPYVYLGYWIKNSEKMDYKRRFTPLEVLEGRHWRRLEDHE